MQAVRARGRGTVVVRSLKIKQKSVLTCGFEMIQVLRRVVDKERNRGILLGRSLCAERNVSFKEGQGRA